MKLTVNCNYKIGEVMKKQNLQSKAAQVSSKTQKVEPFYTEKMPYVAAESVKIDEGSIQDRAFQIHNEKGGTALDNWLEAENALKNK